MENGLPVCSLRCRQAIFLDGSICLSHSRKLNAQHTFMAFLIITAKVVASIFLTAFLVAGILKANPRAHRLRPMAEYTAGFIICALSLTGLYYLWMA